MTLSCRSLTMIDKKAHTLIGPQNVELFDFNRKHTKHKHQICAANERTESRWWRWSSGSSLKIIVFSESISVEWNNSICRLPGLVRSNATRRENRSVYVIRMRWKSISAELRHSPYKLMSVITLRDSRIHFSYHWLLLWWWIILDLFTVVWETSLEQESIMLLILECLSKYSWLDVFQFETKNIYWSIN